MFLMPGLIATAYASGQMDDLLPKPSQDVIIFFLFSFSTLFRRSQHFIFL
jgi:hypothetical protein